jgi:effector-binding domain-containing protein
MEELEMTVFRAGLAAMLALALVVALGPASAMAQGRGTTTNAPRPAGDFGLEVTLPEKTIVFLTGSGNWDSAFDTLVDAFKTVYAYLDKEGLAPAGEPMMIYTSADDSGFSFQAAVPIAAPPANAPQGDIGVGPAPSGKAFRFVHRGSYDGMENTYEAITNFFEEKNIAPKDMFIEQYQTDPRSTPEGELVINVLVPVE